MSLQNFAMQISVSLIAFFLYPSSAIPNSSLSGDTRVLISMKSTMDDYFGMLHSWTASDNTTHCSWTGVHCDHLGRIVALDLSNMDLSGLFPNQVTNLSALRLLNVSYNHFHGSLTSKISKLKNLEALDVSYNYLSGALPPEIGNLSKLVHLHFDGCGPSGSIPYEIGGLKNLETLSLQFNGLTGEIPVEFWKLNELRKLDLSENGLQGRIPSFIGDLPNLEVLGFSDNNFTGLLPQQLGVSGKLLQVDVSFNRLTGSIPPNLCKGGRLQILTITNNLFVGPIPDSLGTCNSLVEVHMGQNHLNGSIHADFLYLHKLTVIELYSNYLRGTIPEKINNVSSMLETMDLSHNRFNGSLPSSIGKLSALRRLNIAGNQLTGEIPREISNCSNLKSIHLSNNGFSGIIPKEISYCSALTFIDLSNNRFSGIIPSEISNCHALIYIDLSNNSFSGIIPTNLQNMQRLDYANFAYNDFSGIVEEGCLFSRSDRIYFAGNPNLYVPPSHSCSSSGGRAHLLLALGPLLFCLLLLVVGVAIYKGRAVQKIDDTRLWEMTTFQKLDFGSDDIVECIKEENVIGKGGAGVVYGGIMPNGQQIAVKKLMGIGIGSSNDHGFSAEINTLGKIRHRHLVTLLAFCSSHDTNLLVYEYMPNGSLGEVLHGNNGGHLHWNTRYKIAVEVAKGLRYLHQDCWPLILHRDVKSSNILLDSNFEAHVADFGLAKLLHHSGTSECMSSIAGSFGYIAPEYGYTLKVDEKSDVYSFGVVLLELITGKKPVEEREFEEGMNIAGWVKKMTKSERGGVVKIIDPKLSSFPMEEAMHLFFVALLCLQEQPVQRPSMREIVYMLTHCNPKH